MKLSLIVPKSIERYWTLEKFHLNRQYADYYFCYYCSISLLSYNVLGPTHDDPYQSVFLYTVTAGTLFFCTIVDDPLWDKESICSLRWTGISFGNFQHQLSLFLVIWNRLSQFPNLLCHRQNKVDPQFLRGCYPTYCCIDTDLRLI